MKKLLLLTLLLLLIATLPAARKALLIGNAAYSSRTLKNPVNDASDLEAALKELGFITTLIKDADYRDMYKGIENFTDGLVYGDEAIFYFSGHGVQIADNNYLLPIGDRSLKDKIDFDTFAISATWTLGKLAKARVSVMILDACRDNPTVSRSVSTKKGLAKLEPETGSQYVIYATEKDTEASDGEGRNSPFAQSLLRHIKSPVSVGEELMRLIRSDVKKATNNQQIPTAYGMLDEPYYLVAPASQPTERVVQTPSQPQAQVIVSYGTILVSGNLEGELWLDGSKQGKLPANSEMRISNVQSGSHNVELRAGDKNQSCSVNVSKDQEIKLDFSFDLTPAGMVFVESGSFMMGSNDGDEDEKPVHKVTVSSFYIGKYEVTVAEFATFVDATGYKTSAESGNWAFIWNGSKWEQKKDASWNNPYFIQGEKNPVTCVSWFDAIAYCNWLSNKEGLEPCYSLSGNANPHEWSPGLVVCNWQANGYRLPTEAEWEFAARGGVKSKGYQYSGSDDVVSVAWYLNNSEKKTQAVGTKQANELGIYDMSGNIREWCWDWYDSAYFTKSPSSDPRGADSGSSKILKGGVWFYYVGDCRMSYRPYINPSQSHNTFGFRIARAFR